MGDAKGAHLRSVSPPVRGSSGSPTQPLSLPTARCRHRVSVGEAISCGVFVECFATSNSTDSDFLCTVTLFSPVLKWETVGVGECVCVDHGKGPGRYSYGPVD